MLIAHDGWPQTANLALIGLPGGGDSQTAATIGLMCELVREDARDERIRAIAHGLPFVSPSAYAAAVYEFVRKRIRFLRDDEIVGGRRGRALAEVLIRPVDLIAMRDARGDCDDFSMLAAALLLARGVGCSFLTVAANREDCSQYSHVYVVAHTERGDVAIDASHGPWAGWETPDVCGKRRLWRVDEMSALGFTAASSPQTGGSQWWDLIGKGLDIVGARYGTPENTYIRRPDGSIVTRGSGTMSPTGAPTEVRADVRTQTISEDRTDAWLTAGGSSMLVLAALAVLALILVAALRSGK
jgi:hypothetical protein